MTRYILLVFILAISAAIYQVNGQQPTNNAPDQSVEKNEDPALRITTELLQIDAVVTDKKGKPLDNLTQDDFELIDNGKPQKIELFKVVRANPAKPLPTANPDKNSSEINTAADTTELESRVFVILIDDLHVRTPNIQLLKKQLRDLIDNRFTESDRVAIVTVSGSLGFLQQLTSDRRVNRRAIDELKSQTQPTTLNADPSRLTEVQAQRIQFGDIQALNLAIDTYIANTAGAVEDRSRIERDVKALARQIVEQLARQTTATLSSLRNTMKLLKTIPGRKSLVLISDGFLTEARDANNLNELTRVTTEATRAGVVVYSMSSNSLTSLNSVPGQDITQSRPPTITSIQLEGQENILRFTAMSTIATETGGFALNNLNDLSGSLAKVVNDSETYYLFGYYPQESDKGNKFHEVRLKLKNADGRRIRTRRGFYEINKDQELKLAKAEQEQLGQSEKKDKDKKDKKDKDKNKAETVAGISEELSKALSAFVPLREINVKASGSFLATSNNEDNALVSLAINLANVQFNQVNNHYQNLVETALVVFAEDGKVVHSTESKLDLNFTEQNYQRNGRGWFFFGNTLSLKPGLYNIRFAVRDPLSNALGSISEFIEVPDLTKPQLTLSSILVFNEAPPKTDKIAEKNNGQTKLNGSAQALRFFSRKGFLGFLSYIYNLPRNANNDSVISEIRISRNGELVATALRPVEVKADKYNRIPISSTIPLKDFPPGRYQLRIEVQEKQSGQKSSQVIDFVIG